MHICRDSYVIQLLGGCLVNQNPNDGRVSAGESQHTSIMEDPK